MKYIEWEEDARNGENKKDRWIYQHSGMTNKMPAERKASKKTWENMPLGETPETLIRNTKAIRHTHSSSSQRPTRETVSWKSERLQVSKKQVTDMKGLKGICWWRDRRVWKGETQCQAWGLLFEKSYYQAEGTPLSVITLNQGLWAVGNIHWIVCTHMCTHTGLSPYPRQDRHTPCTAPGCRTGHLLRTTRKKLSEQKRAGDKEGFKPHKNKIINLFLGYHYCTY